MFEEKINITLIILILLFLFIILFGFLCGEYNKYWCLDNFEDDSDLLVWGWGIGTDEKYVREFSQPFLVTAEHFNLNTKLLGLGTPYADWNNPQDSDDGMTAGLGLQRFFILEKELDKIEGNPIILVCDTADVIFKGNSNEIINKFLSFNTEILGSSEKVPTYHMFIDNYNKNAKGPYKYLAAGTYIGYAQSLKKMLKECIDLCCVNENSSVYNTVEMTVMGKWANDRIVDQSSLIKIDDKGELFWVTTGDDEKFVDSMENNFINPETNTRPLIFHLVGPNIREKYMYKAIDIILKDY